jgi:Predicted membrane protein (DUF2079)
MTAGSARRAASAASLRPATALSRARARAMPIPFLLSAAAGFAGFAWMAWLGWRRAEGLATNAFDQAYFQQLVWSIGHGHGFHSSFNPGDFLGLHFSPLLIVPAVVEVAWPDARVLTILQAVALGATAPAAFLLIRAVLGPGRGAAWLAMALATPLPIWPIMQQQVRADFHTEALALPLELLAGWAGLTRRTGLMFALAAVALLAKEDQVYPVAVIGLLVAARAPGRLLAPGRPPTGGPWRPGARLRTGPRRNGLVLASLAITWGIAVFGVVKPFFRAGATYDTDRYYAWLGGGLGVVNTLIDRTDVIGAALTRPAGWIVVAWLMAGLGGLALLRPRWLALVLPPLVAHLLSTQGPQHDVLQQYGLLLVVPAVVAAALGGRRSLALLGRWRRRWARSRAGRGSAPASDHGPNGRLRAGRPWAFAIFAAPALVAAVVAGSVPPFSGLEPGFWDRPAAIDQLRAVAARVPEDAVLSVDWDLASAVASRPSLELLPYDDPAAWVLVDQHPYVTGYFRWADRDALADALEVSGRPLLVDDGRFRLWGPVP